MSPTAPEKAGLPAPGRDAFLKNRGLQDADGRPRPAWQEWVRMGK